jgi:hypothetical protein
MAYHPNAMPNYILYRSSTKAGGWNEWALGKHVDNPCAACRKRGDSCLRVVVSDHGDVDLGVCVWCRTRAMGCSTAQRHRRVRAKKPKVESEPKSDKRKLSEVEDSEGDEGEGPSSKKVKPRSVIEDSDGEDWLGDREDRVKKDMVHVEEFREDSVSEVEVRGETENDKGKRKVKEARKARRLERSELMREMIMAVRELGSKVDRFAHEVRASSILRNRADREYLEERRQERHVERLRNARRLRGEDSEDSSE